MNLHNAKIIALTIALTMLSACNDEDYAAYVSIPMAENTVNVKFHIVQGSQSSVDGFSAAQYVRDTYGVVYDSVTIVYPRILINFDFNASGTPPLSVAGGSTGLDSLVGVTNQIAIIDAKLSSDSASIKTGLGGSESIIHTATPYASAAGDLTGFQNAIRDVLNEHVELFIPGKDGSGQTRVLLCNPGSVVVSCLKLQGFSVGGAWYYGGSNEMRNNQVFHIVKNTACSAEVKLHLSTCQVQ